MSFLSSRVSEDFMHLHQPRDFVTFVKNHRYHQHEAWPLLPDLVHEHGICDGWHLECLWWSQRWCGCGYVGMNQNLLYVYIIIYIYNNMYIYIYVWYSYTVIPYCQFGGMNIHLPALLMFGSTGCWHIPICAIVKRYYGKFINPWTGMYRNLRCPL